LPLSVGTPYIIQIYLDGYNFRDYQFSCDELPLVTLGGTVDFSSLSSWTTDFAGVLIFSGSDYTILGTGAVDSGDTWSVSASLPTEVFIAMVARSSGGEGVMEAKTVSVSGDDPAINFSPDDSGKNVKTGEWYNGSTAGEGDWLLWIPENAGTYVLDAEKLSISDPYMYLYDGLSGALIEHNDDGGGNLNSRIQRSDFVAGYPYLIRVRDLSYGAGDYRFKAEAVSP
jgi:hypothetical protein